MTSQQRRFLLPSQLVIVFNLQQRKGAAAPRSVMNTAPLAAARLAAAHIAREVAA